MMPAPGRRRAVAVAGPGACDAATAAEAQDLGAGLARRGLIVVTGGRGGVMEAASRGAREARGTVVALLPGTDRDAANPWAEIVLPTGLGDARNALLARSGDLLVAFLAEGGAGTLSEVALALKGGVPVVLVGGGAEPLLGRVPARLVHAANGAAEALRAVDALLA